MTFNHCMIEISSNRLLTHTHTTKESKNFIANPELCLQYSEWYYIDIIFVDGKSFGNCRSLIENCYHYYSVNAVSL